MEESDYNSYWPPKDTKKNYYYIKYLYVFQTRFIRLNILSEKSRIYHKSIYLYINSVYNLGDVWPFF